MGYQTSSAQRHSGNVATLAVGATSSIPVEVGDANVLVTNLSKREIPSLYGLRGAAALAVVLYHYLLEHPTFAAVFPDPTRSRFSSN